MADKQKLVYIYGLGFSGSTLLDLILGAHPRITGFGEVWSFFKQRNIDYNKTICGCGKFLNQCSFWRDFRPVSEDPIAKYREFINLVRKKYGTDQIIVDSSKEIRFLEIIREKLLGLINLKVIYLIRDVRGFSFSAKVHRKERGKWGNVFLYQIAWWQRNRKFMEYLRKSDLPYIQISYEEICFRREEMLKRICEFLEVEFSAEMFREPFSTSSHSIAGNIAKFKFKKRGEINYDYRWMKDYPVNLSYGLLPFVVSWNRKNVYKNLNQ